MPKTISKRKHAQINKFEIEEPIKKDVRYSKTTLSNGLRIISEEVPGVESFALGIFINAGSRNDPEDLSGIAHFVEHTTFRHTKKRNFRQIANRFESVGAYFNAFTTKEHTSYYVRALRPHFRRTLELLADIVLNPLFILKDAEKERSIILEEIKSAEDDPEDLIFDFADQLLFKQHPLANPIAGTQDSVLKISQSDLLDFHRQFYNPKNIVVSVAGCIKHEQIEKEITLLFSDIGNWISKLPVTQNPSEMTTPSKIEIAKPIQQSHLLLCHRCGSIKSTERYPMAALNILFGEGMSSRLNQQLREKRGLAYSIYSTLQLLSDCGGFYIYAATEEKQTSKVEKLIFNEMNKILLNKITQQELQRAKEQLKTSVIMALESMSTRMEALAKNEFYLERREDIPATIAAIDDVSLEVINKIIEMYFMKIDWSEVIFYSSI